MFDAPKSEDLVQGKNSTCTVAEFNAMSKLQKRIFCEGELDSYTKKLITKNAQLHNEANDVEDNKRQTPNSSRDRKE